jgi:hypothetical protein
MTEGLDLHLGVDKAAGFVGRALETALREAIRSGRLHPGARLPGSRSLAAEDPGLGRHRDVLHAAGLATMPLEVGAGGADPGDAARLAGRARGAARSAARGHG